MAKTFTCGCGPRTRDPYEIRDREDYGSERYISRDIVLTCSQCKRPIVEEPVN